MNKKINSVFLCFYLVLLVLGFVCFSWAGDYVYTNEDLEKYQKHSDIFFKSPSGKGDKVKVVHGNIEVNIMENKEIINNEIELKIAGCPTLQDGLDNQKGSGGSAKFKIMTQGRTIQEICDSVGYGCRVCEVSK